MPTTIRVTILIRVLIAGGTISLLVLCEGFMLRMGVGVGILLIAPWTIWQSTKHAFQIGNEEGKAQAVADLICAHVRYHADDKVN